MLTFLPLALAVIILAGKATSKYCDGDYFCNPPKECCTLGCCYLYPPPAPHVFNLVSWNHWYLWCFAILGLALVFVVCGCGLWRKRDTPASQDASSEPDSAGSCYQPPHYSRCSSFHQPPPYSEVTSKPELYPLVISYGDSGKTGGGVGGGSYLMVQYFRNYIMRPVGSLSAASTTDSLSSSLFCSAANEANSCVPPPYSSAPDSVDQLQGAASPFDELEGVCVAPPPRPSLCGGLSTVSSVGGLGPLDSPPQATSPTSEVRQLLHKINQLPNQQNGGSGSSSSSRLKLYMPLSRGRHWLSRSAPTTPSSRLTPALPFPSGESSPLLQPDADQDITF